MGKVGPALAPAHSFGPDVDAMRDLLMLDTADAGRSHPIVPADAADPPSATGAALPEPSCNDTAAAAVTPGAAAGFFETGRCPGLGLHPPTARRAVISTAMAAASAAAAEVAVAAGAMAVRGLGLGTRTCAGLLLGPG